MGYHFKNLIFEGGGVKGIAYVGAMQELKKKGILKDIKRVGGTSAGAINALLFALGHSNAEQTKILRKLDFNEFKDDSWGVLRDAERLVNKFGLYKGDFFHEWVGNLIEEKLGDKNATFKDLQEAKRPDLYVYGTNLSTTFGEVFSVERTPGERIADAVRISMSIPLFFAAIRNARDDVYVDGGVLNNYPVKLFDRRKYLFGKVSVVGRDTKYYEEENEKFLGKKAKGNNPSKYIFNRETLGFRLDTAREIAAFRYGKVEKVHDIDNFVDYVKALMTAVLESQQNSHLHSDDWQRTVYIDSIGVSSTDFDLDDKTKNALVKSGRTGTQDYFKWYDKAAKKPTEKQGRPANAP